MDGSCDVKGCTNETYMGWRPLTERLGKQICEGHWNRHKDPGDGFSLFEAFGFRRPAGGITRDRGPSPELSGCRRSGRTGRPAGNLVYFTQRIISRTRHV